MKYITKRGWFVIGVLVVLVLWWAFDVTTPEECKVEIENMSQFCKDLLYP
jgi:hypothetical protein